MDLKGMNTKVSISVRSSLFEHFFKLCHICCICYFL